MRKRNKIDETIEKEKVGCMLLNRKRDGEAKELDLVMSWEGDKSFGYKEIMIRNKIINEKNDWDQMM